jgi:hypothetical protein
MNTPGEVAIGNSILLNFWQPMTQQNYHHVN